MRRRLTLAIVGMVIASLVLAGAGTTLLTAAGARQSTEENLREQAEAFSDIVTELFFTGVTDQAGALRQRVQRVLATMSVEGMGVLVLGAHADEPLGELPMGLAVEELDLDALRGGETVSDGSRDLVWAAHGRTSEAGLTQILVLAQQPDPIWAAASGWFLIASAATIAMAAAVAMRLSRRLVGPIAHASIVSKRIATGDLSARVPAEHAEIGGEVGELVTSVNTMAEDLQRSRDLERQFLLSVSHDLRTPLTSILGYAEALTDGAIDDPVRAGSVISAEGRRLERLVGDLLLLARLEGTGFEYDREVHDIRTTIRTVTDGLQPDAATRSVELAVRVPDEPTLVMVDPIRLAQIVSNLVSNAARFAATTVTCTLWVAEGRVHLAVGDDGPGIADADLPHVFERLYVAQHSPAIQESGSGLGLAIVRELAEGMDGTVTARRSALGGAEIVVSFRPER